MTTDPLELVESPIYMSSHDERTYTLDTTDYGGSPTSTSQAAVNLTSGLDVSSLVLTGSILVSDNVITWKTIFNLQKGQEYAVNFEFVCGGQRYQRRLVVFALM